jgi:hypothetical protein
MATAMAMDMPMPALAPADSPVLWCLVRIKAVGVDERVVEEAVRDVDVLDTVDVGATRVKLKDVAPVWLVLSQCAYER